jgi:hypothetical protein
MNSGVFCFLKLLSEDLEANIGKGVCITMKKLLLIKDWPFVHR